MKLFEGMDRIADLSKGWQQFVLGAVLFYFVFSVMLGNTVFSFFSLGFSQGASPSIGLFSHGFIMLLAYSFGAVFFLVLFIKHYNFASEGDLGFVLSLIAGALILAAFGTLYELSPIIQQAIAGDSSPMAAAIAYAYAKPNAIKTIFSIAFYAGAGFFLARLGNRINKGNTPFIGIPAILILPMAILAAFFTLGQIFEGIVSAIFSSAGFSLGGIVANLVLFVVFAAAGIALFLSFLKNPEKEKLLRFQALALRITGGAFGALLLLSILSFSALLLIDFEHTELMVTLSQVAAWIIRVVFYGFMVFAVFRLHGFTGRIIQGGFSIQFQQRQAPAGKEELVMERLKNSLKAKSKAQPVKANAPPANAGKDEKTIEKLASALKSQAAYYSKGDLARALEEEGYSHEIVNEALKRLGY